MPLRLENGTIWLEGRCPAEESEALLEQLRADPMPPVDLGDCEDIHSAVLQVLLAARPVLSALPADPFLADMLSGLTISDAGHEISSNVSADLEDRNDPGA